MSELKKYTVVIMGDVICDDMRVHWVNAFDSKEAIKLAEHIHFLDMDPETYQACVFEGHGKLVDEV